MRHGIKVSPLATPEVLKAIGVGAQVSPTKTSSVAESLTAFLNASKAYTDAFRAAGVLDSDLAEASSLLGNLLQADEAQQDAQDTKKELTEQKNAAQLRIEGDVASIAAAGQMHFRKETAKRAVFEKLLPKSKPKGEKGEETVPKT